MSRFAIWRISAMPARFSLEETHPKPWEIISQGRTIPWPTSGTARFSSPLGVDDFVKRSSFTYYTKEALTAEAEKIGFFARREGLEAHAHSALVRKDKGVIQ